MNGPGKYRIISCMSRLHVYYICNKITKLYLICIFFREQRKSDEGFQHFKKYMHNNIYTGDS